MASNRNKLADVFLDFFNHMVELVGSPSEGTSPAIQKVAEGEAGLGAHPIPFLVIQFLSAKPIARADTDLVWECQIRIRIISRASGPDGATDELLTKIGLVQNKIQAYTKPLGVDGFDQTEWATTFPISPAGPAMIEADSLHTYTVAIAHGAN